MAIAPVRQQINKNTHEENHIQYVQSVARYNKNKKLSCCNPNREGYQVLHLAKGDLGATTAKRPLLYVSRHINPVAGCSLSHTPKTKLNT